MDETVKSWAGVAASGKAIVALVMSQIRGVGPKKLRRVLAEPIEVLEDVGDWPRLLGKPAQGPDFGKTFSLAWSQAQHQFAASERYGDSLLCLCDDDYPEYLRETPDAPILIFVRGRVESLKMKALAVVGTQAPTEAGRGTAWRVAHRFSERGWSIVSGLDGGVNTQAHVAALAANGVTVAVIAQGLSDVPWSRLNTELARRIVRGGGAIVTEYGYGVRQRRGQHIHRDRTMAGISRGVCLVEDSVDGSSLHACRSAIFYKRPLLVPVPSREDVERNSDADSAVLAILGRGKPEPEAILKAGRRKIADLVMPLRTSEDYEDVEARLLRNESLATFVAAIRQG